MAFIITKESIIEKTYSPKNLPSFPSGPEALWAGGQRGESLPFVSDPERSLTRRVKGGK